MKNYIYAESHFNFLDKIVKNRREKFFNFIKSKVSFKNINSYLDIGTTQDENYPSSNYLNKKFNFIKKHNSVSDQKIHNKRFSNTLQKSITENFSKSMISTFKSDFVISNATIEHVGSCGNQKKMIDNMIKLSNNIVVIQTINRFFPIETHTKLPLLHFLPKKIHRKILKFLGHDYYSLEKNLNMLSYNDMSNILKDFKNKIDYKIYRIFTFGFVSNILVICYKKPK
jgi:hypothetical protein|tara:strand:- start:75 stop:755 length:681 start_codon:yes stop_codon:yes gene_type:complete